MSTKCAHGGAVVDLIRIGDKLISFSRIVETVQEMLDMRQQGFSQADVAKKFNTDRTFCRAWKALERLEKAKR